MAFNSIDFPIFLTIVFCLYWAVGSQRLKIQNIILLASSYIFYGWWDWRFLVLIVTSCTTDYMVGLKLSTTHKITARKFLLAISLAINLILLGIFKYYNFFIENFTHAFTFLGFTISNHNLNIILPMGISFYTFQTMSYTIDVYRRKIPATNSIIVYFGYVSFFPQLTAGPIERASNLLPQFMKPRFFSYNQAVDGLRQILWGLFKKIVIADNCGWYVNHIFSHYWNFSGSTLLLTGVLFSFQIYGDFSGYSDIAIGSARLFGFNLTQNFAFPYFSRSIAEFWRRWHISLNTWFRDYIYIPLGGNRKGTTIKIRNLFTVFLLSGLWHGANWTFIFWGLLNAIYLLPYLIDHPLRQKKMVAPPPSQYSSIGYLRIFITFFLTTIAWIFFRSETITDAFRYIKLMLSPSIFSIPEISPTKEMLGILGLLAVEWIQRERQHGLDLRGTNLHNIYRWGLYYTILSMIVILGGNSQPFIYFQF